MTLAVVWKQEWQQEAWLMAIADTRISSANSNVLTEHGPKILPITVICKQPGSAGFSAEAFRSTIGFAHSGSTLSALSSHALASALLSNLIGNTGAAPPALADIAYTTAGVAAEYMRDVCQLSGLNGLFRAIIFGFCHRLNRFLAYQLDPQVETDPLAVRITQIDFENSGSIAVIGTNPQEFRDRLQTDLTTLEHGSDINALIAQDAPKRVLQTVIDECVHDAVGGTIQQARVTRFGFETVANLTTIQPRPPSNRNFGMLVLGFDILDMRYVGEYMVGTTGY